MSQEATMQTFHTPGPVKLRVELWSGEAHIRAEETAETTVELVPTRGDGSAQDLIDRARVEQRGDEVVVLLPRVKSGLLGRKGEVTATIHVPTGSSIDVQLGSADLDTRGELGRAQVGSGSGEVYIEHATDVTAKSGSGDVAIGTVSGSLSAKTGSAEAKIGYIGGDADCLSGSGDIEIRQVVGSFKAKAGSGDIEIGHAGDSVDLLVGSGDLQVHRIERGRLKAKTGSGDILVAVAHGTAAYLDIMTGSGETKSSLNASDGPADGEQTVELSIRTGSGDVVLQRA
ncbi:MAG: DUF4097 family beta strand repeat protein [Nocardioidaceae bacterium]|nr:DUF4097 family beta strand repeat protein [Nocardioidaceae bacterium]